MLGGEEGRGSTAFKRDREKRMSIEYQKELSKGFKHH
jgi:hypothetical protein